MKTNKVNILMTFFAMLLFAACTEEIVRDPSPVAADDCESVFFAQNNVINYELDPTDPTSITVTIARQVADEAAVVPIKVISNTDSVFVIPESVAFAAGEDTTTFNVTFAEAEEGLKYTFEVSVEGDKYLNPYLNLPATIAKSITRIKWDAPVQGVMIEGFVSAFFGVSLFPFYVEIEKASLSGGITRYRMKNPFKLLTLDDPDADGIFDGYPYNAPADMLPGDYYLVMNVASDGKVSMAPQEVGFDWGYGSFSIGTILGNLSQDAATYPLGTFANSTITFGENSLFVSMADYKDGEGRVCATPTIIYLTKAAYLATLEE